MKLSELMEHFFNLYGRRNRIFLSGLRERIDYLNLGICDLQEAIRKEHRAEIIGAALARIVARIFCLAEHFWSLPFIAALSQKYPPKYCSYCQKFPCQCPEKRPDIVLGSVSASQLDWSLAQWQAHLDRLYGERNRMRGGENLLNRLFKEIGELLSLQMQTPRIEAAPAEVEQEFALELADALAWTIALANFLGVDLEQAVLGRYGEGCWKCQQTPCQCSNFNVKPLRWEDS